MKKSLLALVIIFCSLLSCEKEEKLVEPQLIVSADTLLLNNGEIKVLYLSTTPASECDFQVISSPDWVSIYPTFGTIKNNIAQIEIFSLLTDNLPGIYKGEIEIMSSSGNKTILIREEIGEVTAYDLSDHYIDFSIFSENKNLKLTNKGNIPLKFEVSVSNDFVSLSSTSGIVDVFEEIDFKINKEIKETGSFESQLFFNINNELDTVTIKIENLKEQKNIIEANVIDAEYSKVTNELVYVTTDPLQLTIYNTINKNFEHIPLDFYPTCVSVSYDGAGAVIGHDAKVSYVNLAQRKIENVIDVSCMVFDIAIKGDEWAYVISNKSSWSDLFSINLKNGSVHQSSSYSYHGKSNIRLHPSEKYLYIGDNNVSPRDIQKVNVQNGIAEYMYDSRYHGDYPSGGKLWFSEDGMRIFSQNKSVFKCSEYKDNDLLYNGTISTENIFEYEYYYSSIQSMDYSSSKDNLYIILSENDWGNVLPVPNIYVYNALNLTYKKTVELEKYIVKSNNGAGKFYEALPYFVFSNSSNDDVYVITKAHGSGLLYEWALQTITIN